MSELVTIVTHPGGAHKDDFLACAVLLARSPVSIERREPTAEDLEDPRVAVVDVGDRHEPEKHNFDHHQFARDAVPTCALSLVLQWMGRYEDAREFCDWLEMAEWLDCRGAFGAARQFGLDPEVFNQLLSPLDVTLLRRFARSEKLVQGDLLWEVMRWVGADLLEYLDSLHARMEELENRAEWWTVEWDGAPRRVLFLPRQETPENDPSAGLDRFIARQPKDVEVIGMISPDRRGEGYGLSRYRDDRRLDFSRIGEEPDVQFAHANGFVAKTSATDPERLRILLEASLVKG
jgi:hypothetical protein